MFSSFYQLLCIYFFFIDGYGFESMRSSFLLWFGLMCFYFIIFTKLRMEEKNVDVCFPFLETFGIFCRRVSAGVINYIKMLIMHEKIYETR